MGGTFREMGWEDREVKVRRSELLETLRKNRAIHVAEYKEAAAGYRAAAVRKIEEVFNEVRGQVDRLKEGETIALVGINFSLPVPVNHEKAYDQIIKMMEMSVDDVIELTSGQFACFVMDDWEWKAGWKVVNESYSGGSVRRR